jgi:hypothetical protein
LTVRNDKDLSDEALSRAAAVLDPVRHHVVPERGAQQEEVA